MKALPESVIPKLRAPIVLVHGLFGFDRFAIAGATMLHYFAGIPELLRKAGNRVLAPSLTPTGAIAQRAAQLKEFLQRESPHEPVHLLAHSMGGLDSRYMITHLGMAERVLSLTTLGTPHHGTAFADWAIGRLERLVKPVLDFVQMPYQGFYDLTREKCRQFNEATPDAPGIRYFSVGGKHDGTYLNPEWLLPYHIVLEQEGPNDGVVSLQSSQRGEAHEIWEGDHLSLVNWFNPMGQNRGYWRDPSARYGSLLRRLADLGY